MGTRTMAAHGDSGGQQNQIHSLAKQGSLYNLTLNEVESHLGEPLTSMNLDELLKTVMPEELIALPEADSSASQAAPGSNDLQRQGSITMPQGLSKKTVDEVWRDIQQGVKKSDNQPTHDRQPSLGEMTLEDFLIKAGIFSESSAKKGDDVKMHAAATGTTDPVVALQDFTQGTQWLQQQFHQPQNMMGRFMQGRPVMQPIGVCTRVMLDAMYRDGQMTISSPTVGTLSDPQATGRKRGASAEMMEKMLERRQKRMIKNRESAARSRARKQAYTNELESKISLLDEENKRLKKEKEFERLLPAPQPEPSKRYQLRRTSSAPL